MCDCPFHGSRSRAGGRSAHRRSTQRTMKRQDGSDTMLVAQQTVQAQRCQPEGCPHKRYDGKQYRQIGYRLQLAAAVSMRRCHTGIWVRVNYPDSVDIVHVHEHGRAAPIPYEEYCEQHGDRYSASVPHHSTLYSGDKNTKNTIEKRARTCIFFEPKYLRRRKQMPTSEATAHAVL